MIPRVTLILLLILAPSLTHADHTLGLKLFGLSIHPKGEKENAFMMPRKLDQNAYFVMNLGLMGSYDYFFYQDIFSVRVVQAFYSDCASRPGGFSHIGFRGKIFRKGKHSLYGGIGPTLIYRKNWLDVEGYNNPGFFQGDEDDFWQYKFIWYGGEFEYGYDITENLAITTAFIPGYPDLMSLSAGARYWFH